MDDYKENTQILWSCGITLLTLLLSESVFPNLAVKTGFLLVTMFALFLYFKGREKESRGMQYLSYALAVCLVLSFMTCAFFPDLPSRLLDRREQPPQEEPVNVSSSEEDYRMTWENTARSLEGLQNRVAQVSEGLGGLFDGLGGYSVLSEKIDPSEVQELHGLIEEWEQLIETNFPDIKTKRADLELFYKTQLYDRIYHYSSYIRAFEDFGIDCAQLGVDRHTLMLWDIEDLYILYSMKKELEPDLKDNKWYEEKGLNFNSNKASMNRHSDLLDYGGWCFNYENRYAEDLEKLFHDYVMNYYKKFHMNFAKAPV